MDRQKFRITRRNADFYGPPGFSGFTNSSFPCSGGTNFFPINFSTNCVGLPMYASTGTEVMHCLSGDMTTFPIELRECSPTNPCVILWDLTTSNNPAYCVNEGGQPYVLFTGLQLTSGGTITPGTYNELMTVFPLNNAQPNLPIFAQGVQAYFDPSFTYCLCTNPLAGVNLSELTVFLSQDFNDIGHYSIWDGNIDQQDIFSNFVFTATTSNPWDVIVYNTTDFSFYQNLASLPYVIDWGDGQPSTTVQPPQLAATHSYTFGVAMSRKVTITQQTPWGPLSMTQLITLPNHSYQGLLATGGLQPQQYGAPAIPVAGPGGSSTAYHGVYGVHGTNSYMPLDSGININQYSGMAPTICFEITGLTESVLGLFQSYSTLVTHPFLPGGYNTLTPVPLGNDYIDPNTGLILSGMIGVITEANANYTGYTISSANGNTPIDFYDFYNGITVFIALSCGLDANAFGGEKCYQCEIQDCQWCENVDEYYDPVLGTVELILFNSNQGVWNSYTDYQIGDIVFDTTNNICCCYMAVKEQIQTAGGGNSPWAFIPPGMTFQGIWYSGGTQQDYLWHACSVDCNPCPPGTSTPCNDPLNPFNTGAYNNSTVYTIGDFAEGPDGNCYEALNSGLLVPPTGGTSQQDWDYVGCVSWICPPDVTNVGPHICEMISGQTQWVVNSNGTSYLATGYPGYSLCIDAWTNNECPTESRWLCVPDNYPTDLNTQGTGQYGCGGLSNYTGPVDTAPIVNQTGCVEITGPNDPTWGSYYNNPSYPFAEVFSSQTDCYRWCNPLAYSCTTPTQPPFCQEISCYPTSSVSPGEYTAIMNFATSTYSTPLAIANNMDLWVQYSPTMYTISDCQQDCGNLSGWTWDCVSGCIMVWNGPFTSFTECAQASNNPLMAGTLGNLNIGLFPSTGLGGEVPCGWTCVTPYVSYCPGCVPPTSPCIPCYTIGCGTSTEYACAQNCALTASCKVCACTGYTTPSGTYMMTPVSCDTRYPCPTYIAGSTTILGANPLLGTYPDTYAGFIACTGACDCDGGWDCALDVDPITRIPTGLQYDPCSFYNDEATLYAMNRIWSPGGPYNSESACCVNTNCCKVQCDDSVPGMATAPTNSSPWTYPCYYSPFGLSAGPCLGAINGVWCTMFDCLATNPNSGSCATEDCLCACAGFQPNPLTDRGTFQTGGGQMYDKWDLVSHQDADSSLCCYVCQCDIGTLPHDCNSFIPDDGPSSGLFPQPNCWVSCGAQPWPDPVGPCPPCIGVTGATYECTPDGCVPSPCVYPGILNQTVQNCYSASTCDEECRADCYCDYTVNPANSLCVTAQNVILNIDPPGVTFPVFPMVDLNDCLTALAGGMECCSAATAVTWHCDDSCWCDDGSGVPCGTGCVPVFPSVPSPYPYPAPFTSQTQCEDFCTWTCDDQGLASCIFAANTPPGPSTYNSAADCWNFGVSSSAQQSCQCPPTITGWYCDTMGAANGTVGNTPGTSNCVPESFLVGGAFTAAYLSGAYGPGTPSFGNSYQGGSPGFTDQATCESYCRWCCNPTGSTQCELEWGQALCPVTNLTSQISMYSCITLTQLYGTYPCGQTQYEWCCDPVAGCISYLGTMPVGCVLGPFSDLTGCTDECTFSCGQCATDCACEFIGTVLTQPPCDVYSSMTHCQTYLLNNPFF